MYCRNCSAPVNPAAVYCTACGVPPFKGVNFCPNCAGRTNPQAVVCVSCGCDLRQAAMDPEVGTHNWLVTLLLCWFLGVFGIHSFYVGKTGIGIVQLLTLGGCGIWALVDFIMILVGSYRDENGKLLQK